ncbi:hypothetical protein SAY86_031644 [Trapa natans]|uniref:BHLH domain-containing protein n=1 Tax=Trapa natans TaxID=22666 RepID=A0AAN7LRP3_TRANT|nr:hypothetical protein SAY86_031644 [Trapa natans]
MDTAFHLHEEGRANFLQILVQSTGCAYVCLWSCLSIPSCLCSLDGFYQETGSSTQLPSSSAGSLARRLFDQYRQSMFIVDDNYISIPGFAFRTNHPCIQLKEDDLLRLATDGAQHHFYREANIKKAIFMGCQSGEIELGFSSMSPDDVQTLVRALFPEDFSRQTSLELELPLAIEQQQQLNPPPSSSSSWRSLSLDSTEYSPLLLNLHANKEVSSQTPATTMAAPTIPVPQQSQSLLSSILNAQFPIPVNEHEALTRAFLAVITSPSSSTSSSQQQQQNFPGGGGGSGAYKANNPRKSAFRRYSSGLHSMNVMMKPGIPRRDNIMKRAIAYLRQLNQVRVRQQLVQAPASGSRPTSTQLHHMMSERRRREKLNESLQSLRALLPSGTKKDKASVLSSTREYLTSLKAQIEDLQQRNAALEAQLDQPVKEAIEEPSANVAESGPIDVRVRQTSESTSPDGSVELRVMVRRECPSIQLVIRILEFLRRLDNVHLMSMDSDTRISDGGAVTRVNLRLRIEGKEWEESILEEAVRRLVSEVANIELS